MPVLRLLAAVGCVSLSLSAWMLQNGPRDSGLDLCFWVEPLALRCPAWLSDPRIPEALPWALYALAGLALLVLVAPLFGASGSRTPEIALAQFIQRGRDLHERCRHEGEQAVLPDIYAWIDEVSRFLRRLGHRYETAFSDFGGVQLFASQYDTAATREVRQRIQRLSEFVQRLREHRPD